VRTLRPGEAPLAALAAALVVTHKSRDPDFRLWAERIPSPR